MAASLQLFSHCISNTNTTHSISSSSSSNLAPKPVFASSIFTSNSIKSARKLNNHLNSTSDHHRQQIFSFSDINHFQNKSPLVVVDHQEDDDDDDQPLKIGIIGFGNFGQFIAKALQRQGHLVLATSRSDYSDYCHQRGIEFFRSIEGLCEEQPDVVLVCSSILSTESLMRAIPMEKLKPDTIFADVLSVKQFPRNLFLEVLPQGFGIVCTHPMFGPESGKNGWEGLPFVFDKVRNTTPKQHAKCNQFLSIFQNEGCRMVEMSCVEHDRNAAGSQFITHTIGRILSHLDLESTPINTKGYETLLQLTENTVKDSFDLYYGLFMYNVNAQEQIENLDRAFDTVKQKLFGRLHDILRKQIVERVPLQTGPPPMNTLIGESNTTPACNFLPNHDEMKDLSSFAIPSSTGTEYSASQSKDSSSHASITR